jgi:hypothetical protein
LNDEDYQRYVRINLPHARTVVARVGRTLEALRAFGPETNGGAVALHATLDAMEQAVRDFEEDPPAEQAIAAADTAAERARALVAAIQAAGARSDRLGQHVRNLFECLGLPEEGAAHALACGERPDSPLR